MMYHLVIAVAAMIVGGEGTEYGGIATSQLDVSFTTKEACVALSDKVEEDLIADPNVFEYVIIEDCKEYE